MVKRILAMEKIKIGILGATGMVGQRFVSLLENHPWFEVVELGASPRSSGKTYYDSVKERWSLELGIPEYSKNIIVKSVEKDIDKISKNVSIVFSALDMDKDEIKKIEEDYASHEIAVFSNNSAHRWTEDVPIIMPEINPEHMKLIDIQRKNRSWKNGMIAVKPNCSIQSYVPIMKALEEFEIKKINVTTLQAISGAGKTFESWPEILDNVIPYIKGEEEKSENEPLKIFGKIKGDRIFSADNIQINSTCIRVPVSDGHLANINLELSKNISKDEFISALENYNNPIMELKLPSAPHQLIKYFNEEDRPQTKLDRNYEGGMGLTTGRLRKSGQLQWRLVALSHNTIRGAAGGAILMAELFYKQGYLKNIQ
jgi:aspartate-semialdehyde dehydrogenase